MSYLGNNNLPWDISRSSPIPTDAERFSGNNSTTAFTLTRSVNFPTDLEVFVENIQQEPTTAYTVNGNSLLFTEAPPTGTLNVYVVYRNYQSGAQVSLPDGSITYSKLANNIRVFTTDNFTANGNVSSYGLSESPADANTVFVTVDGVVQRAPAHYTTSGSTITFTSAPPFSANVHIRHLGFRTTSTITVLAANSTISQPNIVAPTITGTLTTSSIVPSANATSNIGSPTATYNNIYGTHVGAINAPNDFGFKNRIINGAMSIWQRGTTQSFTNALVYGSVDRWVFIQGGASASISQTQSTSVPTGFQYAIKQQRTAASTTTGTVYSVQEIETVNCYDLAGQTVTLSFWAKCGANFSASGSTLTSLIYQGTGTDQGTTSWISGTWTSPTSSTQSNTLTTSYQKFTQTVTLGASTTELVISLQWVPVGTAGADDSVFITGVQLEKGSIATSFDYRPYGTEFQLCQRYYQAPCGTSTSGIGQGGIGTFYAVTTSEAFNTINFPVPMRTTPTITFYNGGGTSGGAHGLGSSGDITGVTIDRASPQGFGRMLKSAGLTAGYMYAIIYQANAEL